MNLPQHFSTARRALQAARARAAFTMVEIALCLAVIGFALVAIIGVLPIGMSVQKDNREQTIINFDANYLMNALRNGAQGQDSLTNYIYKISIISTFCDANGIPQALPFSTVIFTTNNYSVNGKTFTSPVLTNGYNIIGLLSTPKYETNASAPVGGFQSNNVTADFRAITGSAIDQGNSPSSHDFAFVYRVTVENIPSAEFAYAVPGLNFSAPTDAEHNPAGAASWIISPNKFLQANLHEIRLRYRWPVLPPPSTNTGTASVVYRTAASGLLSQAASPVPPKTANVPLYFINPQSYTNTAQ